LIFRHPERKLLESKDLDGRSGGRRQ